MSYPHRDAKHSIGVISVVFFKHRLYYFCKRWEQLFPSHLVIVVEIIPNKLLKASLEIRTPSASVVDLYNIALRLNNIMLPSLSEKIIPFYK